MNAVPLNRALSKLGILSRAEATAAIRAGRVRVDGRLVRDPALLVVPERARFVIDAEDATAARWRTVAFNKPRGVVTTRRDPQGRPTVFDVLGAVGRGLVAVGRLDLATTGLLLLTSDTQLAAWITSPTSAIPRIYVTTVRGRVTPDEIARLTSGIGSGRNHLRAHAVTLRKASGRESHLIVELREGKNREVRTLCAAIGHDVTRLKRIKLGGLELGPLNPGEWRDVTRDEVQRFFPGAPVRVARRAI